MSEKHVAPVLHTRLLTGAELPAQILTRPFEQYLFFDADLNTTTEMIAAVQNIARACFSLDAEAHIFASSNGEFLGCLGGGADWASEVCRIESDRIKSGYIDGLTLIDAQQRWIAHQNSPVDVGLFAIDCQADLKKIPRVEDGFFTCADIAGWLHPQPHHEMSSFDVDLPLYTALLKTYGGR